MWLYSDLKPENLLLSESGHVMLTDFGMCKQLLEASSKAHTFCGSPEYIGMLCIALLIVIFVTLRKM